MVCLSRSKNYTKHSMQFILKHLLPPPHHFTPFGHSTLAGRLCLLSSRPAGSPGLPHSRDTSVPPNPTTISSICWSLPAHPRCSWSWVRFRPHTPCRPVLPDASYPFAAHRNRLASQTKDFPGPLQIRTPFGRHCHLPTVSYADVSIRSIF